MIVHAGWQESYFRRESDRDILFWLLDGVVAKFSWECVSYCFMTTHLHLLVETLLPTISAGMQQLSGQYAQGFNRRYGRRGHVVESRFWADLVQDDLHLLSVARYMALNPPAAGACRAPQDWLWSSYRATAGYVPSPTLLRDDALLKLFSEDRARSQLEWRRLVDKAIARGEHRKPQHHRPAETAVETSSLLRSRV